MHQNFNYLCTPTDDGFIPRVTVNPDFSFAAVRKAVAEIKERLEEFGREELLRISKSGVSSTNVMLNTKSKTSRFLIMYIFYFTVNEVPVYTTESRTLDRRSRGEAPIAVYNLKRLIIIQNHTSQRITGICVGAWSSP